MSAVKDGWTDMGSMHVARQEEILLRRDGSGRAGWWTRSRAW
jgi:hypothetical protein